MADSTMPEKGTTDKVDRYRFTYPYPCHYDFPGQSRLVEPGEEVAWPDGPPNTWWEPVADETRPRDVPGPKSEPKPESKVAPPTSAASNEE